MTEPISTNGPTGSSVDDYELVSVVVEYDERPDQCTIYHPDSNGIDRMSSWISTDADSLVHLYLAR